MEEKKLSKLQDSASKARSINLAENLIFPLINEMREAAIIEAVHAFKKGESVLVAQVAKISSLMDLEAELKTLQQQGNRAFEQIENLQGGDNGTSRRT